MPIRKALPSDHKQMAKIAVKAFIDDDAFGRFMHPHRREFPEDYLSMWERRIWVNSNDYMREYLVSDDEDTGDVVAWSSWMRMGIEGEKKRRNWGRWLKFKYITRLDALYTMVWPDKSMSPSNMQDFHVAIMSSMHLWDPSKNRLEGWQLECLCTDPASEGKGHGSALVEWGIQEAAKERVCLSVIVAWKRESFYSRFGFEEVGRLDVGPLAGKVKGGAVMFKDVMK